MVSAIDVKTRDHSSLRSPGCEYKVKAALILGAVVGITIGGLYGGSQAFKYGLERREFVRAVGKQMLNMGGTFGVFMAIGTLIRC